MTQNGTVLNRIDPDPLTNSVGHPVDGPPVDVAISPDGKRIAYTFTGYECPVGASCGARSATSYTAADHYTLPVFSGSTYFRDTSWVTNSRTLQFGGYGSQVNLHDVGAGGHQALVRRQRLRGPVDRPRRRRGDPPGHRLRGRARLRRQHAPDLVPEPRRALRHARRAERVRGLRDGPGGRDRGADVVARTARRSRSSPPTASGSSARRATAPSSRRSRSPAARRPTGAPRTSTPPRGPRAAATPVVAASRPAAAARRSPAAASPSPRSRRRRSCASPRPSSPRRCAPASRSP